MTFYTYGDVLPPAVQDTNLRIDQLTSRINADFPGARAVADVAAYDEAQLNAVDGYEIVWTNPNAPDTYWIRDPSLDAHTHEPRGTGLIHQIAQGWREMTYEEARRQARDDLGDYVQLYVRSYFNITQGQNTYTFSASLEASNRYGEIADFILWDREDARRRGTDPDNEVIDFWIFDVHEGEHHVTSFVHYDAFMKAWQGLTVTGQNNTIDAWTDIQNATTTAEVRARVEQLYAEHPIPSIPEP